MTPRVDLGYEFEVESWRQYEGFWGSAAVVYQKVREDVAGFAQLLRNKGCVDRAVADGIEILVSWGGAPPEWVNVRDFPARYQMWNPSGDAY